MAVLKFPLLFLNALTASQRLPFPKHSRLKAELKRKTSLSVDTQLFLVSAMQTRLNQNSFVRKTPSH